DMVPQCRMVQRKGRSRTCRREYFERARRRCVAPILCWPATPTAGRSGSPASVSFAPPQRRRGAGPTPRRGAGPISLCDERHRNERPAGAVGCSSRNRRAGYGGETADITLEDGGYSLPPSAFRECRHSGYGGETADITLEDGGYSLPPSAFRECRH